MSILGKIGRALGLCRQKIAVCYQLRGEYCDVDIVEVIAKYRSRISEVHFSMPGEPSDCVPCAHYVHDRHPKELVESFYRDVDRIHALGLPGILNFTASCWGDHFASKKLLDHDVNDSIKEMNKHIELKGIETFSVPIADTVKRSIPFLEIRASANLHLNDVRQMDYLDKYFTGFYWDPDYNRDLQRVTAARRWCQEHGKTFHMLANSSCLHLCPYHLYHGNLISHFLEAERQAEDRKYLLPMCQEALQKPEFQYLLLSGGWIRPEDLGAYAGLCDTIDVLTRDHDPSSVIQAYCEGRWNGNLMDLLEPSFQGQPGIHNGKFPKDWFERTSTCGHNCAECSYCKDVLRQVIE